MVLQEKEIKDILRVEQRNDIFYIENTNQCLFYPEAWTQDNETSAVDQLQISSIRLVSIETSV